MAASLQFRGSDADVGIELVGVSQPSGRDEALLFSRQKPSKPVIASQQLMKPRRNKNFPGPRKIMQPGRHVNGAYLRQKNPGKRLRIVGIHPVKRQAVAYS
ncbi:hypothetical protein Saso_05120 [Streptomyces asoensis]|uniref:Uncharacterized protein n=1 Tax=Streptomyces asoensis TaxID=249586 RepID=A0ABQ3RSV2_9ACTN|nr:hypothetical protein GCM10010496_06050 [Streptomyces asoensis]GHI58862.1 hypothetical protein Saso_05120 [Streptomyces asoensis]